MDIKTLIETAFHEDIRTILLEMIKREGVSNLEEIRIRLNKPLDIKINGKSHLLDKNGTTCTDKNDAYIINREPFYHTLEKISRHSLYAYKDELRSGFITIEGGHRVGIIGMCVIEDNKVKSVKDIKSLNIRLSHDILGVAKKIDYIYESEIKNTLIISPPGGGKTTLLKDIIRSFSDKYGKTVGVVDERLELSDYIYSGIRTDVISNCPKHIAMSILLRTMNPDVICVDEIGNQNDVTALLDIFNCGVKVVSTIHGKSITDIKNKMNLQPILDNKYFDYFIILGKSHNDKIHIFNKDFIEVTENGHD